MLTNRPSPSQVHEAGHAVIAEQLGIRVKWVQAQGYGNEGHGHTEFEKHDLLLEEEAIVSIAGPVAEERSFGVRRSEAQKSDLDYIIVLVWAQSRKEGNGPLSEQEICHARAQLCDARNNHRSLPSEVNDLNNELLQRAKQKAEYAIEDLWCKITEIAKALCSREYLSGEEVRNILDAH